MPHQEEKTTLHTAGTSCWRHSTSALSRASAEFRERTCKVIVPPKDAPPALAPLEISCKRDRCQDRCAGAARCRKGGNSLVIIGLDTFAFKHRSWFLAGWRLQHSVYNVPQVVAAGLLPPPPLHSPAEHSSCRPCLPVASFFRFRAARLLFSFPCARTVVENVLRQTARDFEQLFSVRPSSSHSLQAFLPEPYAWNQQVWVDTSFFLSYSCADPDRGPRATASDAHICLSDYFTIHLISLAGGISMSRLTKSYHSDSIKDGPNCLLPHRSSSEFGRKSAAFHRHFPST